MFKNCHRRFELAESAQRNLRRVTAFKLNIAKLINTSINLDNNVFRMRRTLGKCAWCYFLKLCRAPQDGRNWRQENRNYWTKIVGHFKQKLIVYQYQEAKYKFFSTAMF